MDLKIVICEDNVTDFHSLESCLQSVCGEWDVTAQITHFFSGEDLLTAQNKNTPPPISFL